ncbi:hypothetical protein T439DRAFT_352123 [Meredithblackwellia eburnea MCA 4105]
MGSVEGLVALGIDPVKARFALSEFDGNEEAAADWCFEEGKDWTPKDLLGTHPPPRAPSPDFDDFSPSNARSSFASRGPTGHGKPPPHRLLIPGSTNVKIILKQDQPTGRTVEGTVKEVLTRGDHPRGVKVRLTDGRVGRVVEII